MALTEKSRSEQFDIWKKRIRIARDLHKEKVKDWADKVFKEYSGDVKSDLETGERYSQVAQVIQAVEQNIQPHLFFQNPKVSVMAKKPEWEKREELVAAVVNHEYTDIKPTGHRIELENELCVLDARLLPFAVTKTSYEVEGDMLEEPVDQGMGDKMKQILTGAPPEMMQTPVIEKEIGQITERINPLNVYLDFTADHITKQKFVIHMMMVRKEDLKKPRYEYEKVQDIEGETNLIPTYKAKSDSERDKLLKDPDFKGFTIYEVHDLENRVIHTLCDGVEDFIEFGTPYPIPEGSVFSWLWFIEVPNEVYPVPPIKFYRKRAKEFSYIYSQVSEQIDKFLPKIGFDVNRLDKPEQLKLKNGTLGTMVAFNGSPSGGWDVINPGVNADLFKYMAMTKELLYMESGLSEYEVSINDGDKTATEASITDKATKARRYAPQKRVKGFLINQAHTIWQILAANADEPQFVKVLGEDDTMEWWEDPETGQSQWTKENIAGDYWFDLDIESVAPQNETLRRQQNTLNMETVLRPELKQGLLEGGQELLLAPIFEKFAKENMGIKDKSKVLRPLDGLEPGDEHTLWMSGQYPPVSERELKDPKFLQKHFEAHQMMIGSPGFQSLPPQIQQAALQHLQQTEMTLMQAQAKQAKTEGGGNFRQTPLPVKRTPISEEQPINT